MAAQSPMMAGIGLTILAYFIFSFHDAAIKWLVATVPVWQILFFRSIVILIGCVAVGRGALLMRAVDTPIKRQLMLRGFVIFAGWVCYYSAARDLQLAELTTLYFAAPILVTVLAIPMLGEQVTGWRWAAVLLGFVGVVVACNPVGLGLSWPVLLAMFATLLWAFAIVLIRRIAMKESALLQMIYGNSFHLACSAVALLFFWRTPSAFELALMLGCGVFGGLGQFALFEAMRRAPASVLAPFEYTALVWAFVLGFAIWADVPRPEVFIGAGLILAAGLLMIAVGRGVATKAPAR
ncbi:MAG: DMT family transporter [Alphaproteobacteria bacterium]|nr:DMT family transporter [Alphaproteobacteria bacterium]